MLKLCNTLKLERKPINLQALNSLKKKWGVRFTFVVGSSFL